MSDWNKYGTVTKDGKIDARFYTTDVEYAAVYELYNQEPVGNKYDFKLEVAIVNMRLSAVKDGVVLGYLPVTWTRFVHEVAERGPLLGTGAVQWQAEEQHFRLRVDVDESLTSA